MNSSLYYQILEIGFIYEKGRGRGKIWKVGERKRLREEIFFWQKIIDYISAEEKGIICSKELFENLERLCKKYKFPNYEIVLEKKEELITCNCVFETNKEEESKICSFMKRLLLDMKKYLDDYKDKDMVYRILAILHNLPKAMHGRNILNDSSHLVSYRDVLNYAQGYMNEKMVREYEKWLILIKNGNRIPIV